MNPEDTRADELPPHERRVSQREIIVKEGMILRVSIGILLLCLGGVVTSVVQSFSFGRRYESFMLSLQQMTAQLSAIQASQLAMKAEIVAYIDGQVSGVTYRRWTQAHEEVATALVREALRKNNQAPLAENWPTVDDVNEAVQKYSTADAAYKRSVPQAKL